MSSVSWIVLFHPYFTFLLHPHGLDLSRFHTSTSSLRLINIIMNSPTAPLTPHHHPEHQSQVPHLTTGSIRFWSRSAAKRLRKWSKCSLSSSGKKSGAIWHWQRSNLCSVVRKVKGCHCVAGVGHVDRGEGGVVTLQMRHGTTMELSSIIIKWPDKADSILFTIYVWYRYKYSICQLRFIIKTNPWFVEIMEILNALIT